MDKTGQQPQPTSRVMTASSWLHTAVPQTDYYTKKNPKVDTSIWALLFSPITPVGIALGIIGIVKGTSGTKNVSAIVWGSIAILMSILIPVIGIIVSMNMEPLYTTGAKVTSDTMGVSVRVPEDA